VIALSGVLGGLIAGLGVVFLSLPTRVTAPVVEATTPELNRVSQFPFDGGVRNFGGANGSSRGTLTVKRALEKIHLNGIF